MDVQLALEHRAQVEEFRRKHRTGLVTLLFTDIVGSTKLKQALGDRAGVAFIQQHHALVREILSQFKDGEEISTAGDSFFIVFVKPSDAVWFSLLLQAKLRALAKQIASCVQDRIGIHIGEVVIEEREGAVKPKDLYGAQVDICSRVMSLAGADQILLTRSAFDNARQVLKGQDIEGLGELSWLNHGPYVVKGWEESLEICEVGEKNVAPLKPPAESEKAHPLASAGQEQVLGWRPAIGQEVPNTKWVLEEKLGEGGFGEVWLGRHRTMKERRVFKFCFRVDRVRSLKREMTLFRLIKERIGDHPNIVALREVYFDAPPFYVEMDYVAGHDLRTWCEQQGGVEQVPLARRLEIVAQAADALQAAHDAGVIHRDVKPGNILVRGGGRGARGEGKEEARSEPRAAGESDSSFVARSSSLLVKLTDFGIGQVVSEECLGGITRAGFTETMMSSSSSSPAGTQMYLAPELLAGKPASTRSDVYSLGVVLFQLLIGDFTRAVAIDWVNEISDPLLQDDLRRCFAGLPQDRFAGAGQLAHNLRTLPDRQAARERDLAEQTARERAAYRRGIMRATALAVGLVGVFLFLALYAFWQTGRAKSNADRAERAELVVRRNLYAADMLLAQRALEAGNLGRAVGLLEKYHPTSSLGTMAGSQPAMDLRGWEWRYLWRRCRSDELLVLGYHANGCGGVSFSPRDSSLLATRGYYDGEVKLWNLRSKSSTTLAQALPMMSGSPAFSPDGRYLAVAAHASGVRLWDLTSGHEIEGCPASGASPAWSVAFSPKETILAIGLGTSVMLWDWRAKTNLNRFPVRQPNPWLSPICISPDGTLLAATGPDYSVGLWNVVSGRQVRTFRKSAASVHAIAFSPDGKTLASGHLDDNIWLWDVSTAQPRATLTNHTDYIAAIAFSPDGTTLVSASGDQTIQLWDTATYRPIAQPLRGHLHEVWTVAYSPDGELLASGSKDGTIRIWSARPKPRVEGRITLGSDAYPLVVSPDRRFALSCATNGTAGLWDNVTCRELERIEIDTPQANFALAPGGLQLAVATNRLVRLWDFALKKYTGSITVPTLSITPAPGERRTRNVAGGNIAGPGRSVDPAYSPDGRILATYSKDEGVVRFWDIAAKKQLGQFDLLPPNRNGRWTFSPDGRWLAVACPPETESAWMVQLWNVETKRLTAHFNSQQPSMTALVFSPDGRRLATSCSSATVKVWNIENLHQAPVTLKGGWSNGAMSIAFSPDGQRLAAGGDRGLVEMWETDTFQRVAELMANVEAVRRVFFPDMDTIVSASCTSVGSKPLDVVVWRAATMKEIQTAGK